MTPTRIFVVGNSHTRALSLALHDAPLRNVDFEVRWLLNEKGDRVLGEMPFQDARERIATLGTDDMLVLSLLGSFHNVYGLLQHEEPFWVLSENADEDDKAPPGHAIVPRRVVEAWFRQMATGYKRMDKLLKGCRAHRFHLMTPPPGGDNKFIASRMRNYRGRAVDESTLIVPELRRRMWAIEKAMLADLLRARGVELLAPPSEALDERGFLKPVYCWDDGVHGNAAYGNLVLQQLASRAAPKLVQEAATDPEVSQR